MADLEAIDFDGVLRRAADKLIAEMGDVSRTGAGLGWAPGSLVQLYLMVTSQAVPGLCPMLITGITIEGVGKFQRPASVFGLGPGVNVLAAGNEAGKSTVFRAVRTCLFKRHNSNDQEIRNLACAEAQLPCNLALEFSRAGRAYEIRKTFVRSVSASLLEDGREIARGRDADEKVWELFGIGAGSAGEPLTTARSNSVGGAGPIDSPTCHHGKSRRARHRCDRGGGWQSCWRRACASRTERPQRPNRQVLNENRKSIGRRPSRSC